VPPRWSGEEDRVLHRLYGGGAPLRVIAERVGRSEDAVAERRRTLRMAARPRQRPWSPVEDELLRSGAALGLPATVIAARLRRPPEQVRRRRRVLVGSRRAPRRFSAAEDAAIAACWAQGGDVEALAGELGRSAGSLRLRARKLGLHRPPARPRWRAYEDAAVRDGYERGLTCTQIATELGGRTAAAIAARAAKLGLATYARSWTAREERDLRRLARDGVGLERAAQLLGRTPEALRARARKLGIPAPRSAHAARGGRPWTAGDDELLRLHAGLNPAALADLVDRSPEAVTQRLRRLGLRAGAERSPHHAVAARRGLTPGQRAVMARELAAGGAGRQLALARRLGLELADVRRARDLIGGVARTRGAAPLDGELDGDAKPPARAVDQGR
jgi:hypothetical protein